MLATSEAGQNHSIYELVQHGKIAGNLRSDFGGLYMRFPKAGEGTVQQ